MPTYSLEYSRRKLNAAKAINQFVDEVNAKKKAGIKVPGNEPKMTLRGLRTFLASEDHIFADLLDKFESGDLSAQQLASKVRSRTEQIGKKERLIHTDTIHHKNPLEIGDALDKMEPDELADFLTEEYEVNGETYGDTTQNVRGQSYTSRGHLNQSANPRGRKKAVNIYSEPGLTEVSAHPRGPNDPILKAPTVKPRTRAEAKKFVDSKRPAIKESQLLGQFADQNVRALANQKLIDRKILLPGQTIYSSHVTNEVLRQAQQSLNNWTDEVDLAKAFKTPDPDAARAFLRANGFNSGPVGVLKNTGLGIGGAAISDLNNTREAIKGDKQAQVKLATETAIGAVAEKGANAVIQALPQQTQSIVTNAIKAVIPLAAAGTGMSIANATFLNGDIQNKYKNAKPGWDSLKSAFGF